MKVRFTILVAVALLVCSASFAQDSPKVELTGDYSFYRLNPGLPSIFNSHSLNGGGGDITFFLKPMIGIKADLQGYGGGLETAVSSKIAIRLVEADYELTRFGNNFAGGNNSHNNFRFQTRVQFRF